MILSRSRSRLCDHVILDHKAFIVSLSELRFVCGEPSIEAFCCLDKARSSKYQECLSINLPQSGFRLHVLEPIRLMLEVVYSGDEFVLK